MAVHKNKIITDTPESVLSSVFGYEKFRENQEKIIDSVIAGDSCCVLMPTGSGKSLCYQIPAICRKGVGIMVSPLIALMQDQVLGLNELGIKAAALHSALEPAQLQQTMRDLHENKLDLIYVAPERLMTDNFLDILDDIEISLFAIDEAHCISQWGHDFRPEYSQLSILRTRYPNTPCIAVTATADTPTRKDIIEKLDLPTSYISGFDRPNIMYNVAIKENPRQQLLRFLKKREAQESGIIYCLSRKKVETTAEWLCKQGFNALPYHAKLDKNTRAQNQERFIKEENVIIVATIAFGMGIDKPDVRFVAHMDLPKNIEAYYQETGRAGRDGLPAVAWMVYGLQDLVLQRQMIENSESIEDQKRIERQKLNSFLGYCETNTCRRQVLLNYFDDNCEPCNNCDTCITPPKTISGTIPAQKALSCIYRTRQIFGAAYIIDILLGNENERIEKFGHKELSTYGIGTEHTRKEWQGLIRQLVAHNFLHVDIAGHGSLQITEKGTSLLKGEKDIELRIDPKIKGGYIGEKTRRNTAIDLDSQKDKDLFTKLRALRTSIAKEKNVPPYVVFHDKTLIDMAIKKPTSLNEMSLIHGIGQSKLEKYGEKFLKIISSL